MLSLIHYLFCEATMHPAITSSFRTTKQQALIMSYFIFECISKNKYNTHTLPPNLNLRELFKKPLKINQENVVLVV